MKKTLFAALAVLASASFAHATTNGMAHLIRIQGAIPAPEAREIPEGGTVSWLNDSTKIARIVIAGDEADEIQCAGQMFRREAGRLESPVLRPNDTLSACALDRGEYTYEVWLSPGSLQAQPARMATRGTLRVL